MKRTTPTVVRLAFGFSALASAALVSAALVSAALVSTALVSPAHAVRAERNVPAGNNLPLGNYYAPFHEEKIVAEEAPADAEELEVREDRRNTRIARVLERARRFLGKRVIRIDGKKFHWDCANYLRAVFHHEFDIMSYKGGPKTRSGVRRIWYFAKRRGGIHFRRIPLVGDLIFTHQTYDANGNRRADDFYTHIAMVEKVDKDGTITYVDRAINGIARRKMNLFFPDHVRHPVTKKVINSHVRPRRRWDEKGAKHLASQLFAGFGTVVQ